MTHKIRRVRVKEYAYYVKKLRQNVGLKIWIWRQIVTSQTAHTKYKWPPHATECNPPWKFSAYATAGCAILFSKEPRFMKTCKCYFSNEHYSAQLFQLVTNLTIWMAKCVHCHFSGCYRLPRWNGRQCDRKGIVTFKYLWLSMARFLFDATQLASFLCSKMQSYQKLYTKAMSILVPFATTYLCESGYTIPFHFKNDSIGTVRIPRMICAWLWVIVCQGVSR